eukprot:gene4695-5031_t
MPTSKDTSQIFNREGKNGENNHRREELGSLYTHHSILTQSEPPPISLSLRKDVTLRAAYLLILFLPVTLTSVLAYLSLWFREVIWFKLLQITVAYSGAAFVKWGQWASTRSDMFPEALCRTLSALQDKSPAHSFSYTQRKIHQAFGKPINEVFSHFDPNPIASGSIAQVYYAVWNNQEVAVKVRHPHVEKLITLDFIIMAAVARFVDSIQSLSWLRLAESVAQFSDKIAAQTDLTVEAEQLNIFNDIFNGWKDSVEFPKPLIWKKNIIIESFIKGSNVANIIKSKQSDTYDSIDTAYFIVTKGEEIYLKMLIINNFMHADLHPGNILFHSTRNNQDKSIKRKIGLVDAGMVAILTPDQQKNFIGLIEAVGEGSGSEAADCVMNFSSHEIAEDTKLSFRHDMINVFKRVAKGYGTDVSLGLVLREVLNLLRHYHITVEANYATLLMNVLCLDGMAHSILPTYNLLDGAKILLQFHRKMKNLPHSLASVVKKVSLPVLLWLKKRTDEKFLKQLKSIPLKEITKIYEGRRKFIV